jgi:Mg/Co/Ni transporter MgtE
MSTFVGGEESHTMPLFKRSSRRLSWLSIDNVLNIIAAIVIALHQDTLEKAIGPTINAHNGYVRFFLCFKFRFISIT